MVYYESDAYLWHCKLAHIKFYDLQRLKNGLASRIYFKEMQNEISCVAYLKDVIDLQRNGRKASNFLETIHSNLYGPRKVASLAGVRYFFTLFDNISWKTFVYFLDCQNEVKNVFDNFKTLVKNQRGIRIKILRTDNGSAYYNTDSKIVANSRDSTSNYNPLHSRTKWSGWPHQRWKS